MPTFHKGNGGKILVGATEVNVAKWEMTKTSELGVTTHSGTGGWVTKKGCNRTGTITIDIPWDSTQIPDTDISLDDGDEFSGQAWLGDSGKFYTFDGVVESVKPVSDSAGTDIVRVSVTATIWNIINPVT